MERTTIIAVLVLFASSAFAMDGGKNVDWYQDWWNNVYEQRIEKEQYQRIEDEAQTRCRTKIRWYEEKVKRYPKSEYYAYKLEQWRSKCLTP